MLLCLFRIALAVLSSLCFHMNFKLFFFLLFCFVYFREAWHWNSGGDSIDLRDLPLVKWPFLQSEDAKFCREVCVVMESEARGRLASVQNIPKEGPSI